MLTNHNTKDNYEKKVENRRQEIGNITRKNLIGTYSIFCQLDISNSVLKITVFLVFLFCLISVILKPFIFNFLFNENKIEILNDL